MKNKLLFLLFLLVPAALAAQEHKPLPKTNYTPGRWYAGVNYGLQRFFYGGSYRNVMGYGGYRLGRHFAVQLGAIYQQIRYEGGLTYIDPPYYADGTRSAPTSENLFGVPLWLRASLLRPERRFNVYLLTGLTAAWQNRQEQIVRAWREGDGHSSRAAAGSATPGNVLPDRLRRTRPRLERSPPGGVDKAYASGAPADP
jgi:hypothetical protein